MQTLNFVLLQVVLLSGLMNDFVNGLEDQTYILCTSVSSWSDAMDTCLNEGGRPLTYDDIKMTNLSEKIDLKVWTAEYTTISNQRWNSSIGRDLLRDTVCGIQTIYIQELPYGSVIKEITDMKYKNCTEQQAYVCDKGQYMQPHVYLNKATWMNAETSCKSQNRRLLTVNQLGFGSDIYVPERLESPKLDVWIGLLASLDFRVETEKGPLKRENIVNVGTFSNSAGFRMIHGYLPNQLKALCGFESLMSVHTSIVTDCLKDVNENLPKEISTSIGEDMTKNLPKDISTSSEDGLSNAATAVISIATTAVVIGSIVTVFHVLYFYRKGHNHKEAKSLKGQITNPSKARVLWSRQDNTADEVCKHNEAEKEANYEEIPDNIQPVHVNGRVESHREAVAMVNHESVYVNKTSEAHHEVSPDNIQHVYVNQTQESRYQPLIHVKESVYVNKTPEGHYEKLVNDNTESVYVNE